MQWWISPNLFWWRNKLIYILDGLRVSSKHCKFLANFKFSVNYSFKGIFPSKKNLSNHLCTLTQMFLATSLTTWNNSNWKYRHTFSHLAFWSVASMIGLLSECNKSVCTWPQHLIHRCVFPGGACLWSRQRAAVMRGMDCIDASDPRSTEE